MTPKILAAALTIGLSLPLSLAFGPNPASAQSLGDSVAKLFKVDGGGCDANVAGKLTQAIRTGIETEVKRAEEALKLPAPLADMGCLDNLFNIDLNTLVKVPSIDGILKKVASKGEEQICGYAQQAFAKVTQPLQDAIGSIPTFENLGIPGFDSKSVSVNFEAPVSGLSGQGQINIDAPVDLNEGTALREIYKNLGQKQQ